MADSARRGPEHWTDEEQRLAQRVSELVGGEVTTFERQLRHRPAWFAEIAGGHDVARVYVRGDRRSDVQPFPDLRRESEIFRVLAANDVPVPRQFGMCEDPAAIVMEAVAGSRDVREARDDTHRRVVAFRYVEILAALHRIPVGEFAAIDMPVPEGADEVSLAGLHAYLPLYRRHKARPEPLLELAIRWLETNVPRHRTTPSFITFDCGQFLFDDSGLTAIYDLEFAMIGDPYADLASMALREPTEPMGAPIAELCAHYATLVGEPLDAALVRYHQVVFSAVSCMQFSGALTNPAPGDPHDVYVMWDIYLRRFLVLALSSCLDLEPGGVEESDMPAQVDALSTMTIDLIAQIPGDDPAVRAKRAAARALAAYGEVVARQAPLLDEAFLRDAVQSLGIAAADRASLELVLEQRARSARDEDFPALFGVLARDFERRRLAHRSTAVGRAADAVVLLDVAPAGSR